MQTDQKVPSFRILAGRSFTRILSRVFWWRNKTTIVRSASQRNNVILTNQPDWDSGHRNETPDHDSSPQQCKRQRLKSQPSVSVWIRNVSERSDGPAAVSPELGVAASVPIPIPGRESSVQKPVTCGLCPGRPPSQTRQQTLVAQARFRRFLNIDGYKRKDKKWKRRRTNWRHTV